MLLQNWSFSSSTSFGTLHSANQSNRIIYDATRRSKLKASLRVGTDVIVGVAHNKVLIAAAVCAAVGQLAKPFTASILYRRDFDPKAAFQAGGFPSTHSSAAVATAMSIGLERGFSDSIFGLAIVYAALTMYDAQGVRREVGVHAKTLNEVLLTKTQSNTYSSDANSLIESSSKKSLSSDSGNAYKLDETSTQPEPHKTTLVFTTDNVVNSTNVIGPGPETSAPISGPLKEAIGHTEIEVAAGALLGVLGSLALYSL